MADKIAATIFGHYLGKIASINAKPGGKYEMVLKKLKILRAEPVTLKGPKEVLELWEEMKKKVNIYENEGLFLTHAKLEYDVKEVNEDDFLPVLSSDAQVLIFLRDKAWNKVPLEAIGVPKNEAEIVSKYLTWYTSMLKVVRYYHYELDKLRQIAIRYAELVNKMEEDIIESNKLITDLQKNVTHLYREITAFQETVERLRTMYALKDQEKDQWMQAYMDVVNKLNELLGVAGRVIDLTNKLSTVRLEKKVEVDSLKKNVAAMNRAIEKIYSEIGELKMEMEKKPEKVEKKSEEKKEEGEEEELI